MPAIDTVDDESDDSYALISVDQAFKGRYEFLGKLGSGGMGIVYKARKMSSGKLVAIKTLLPISASAAAAERFEVEAELLSRLRHPNIVTLLEFGTMDNDVPYMVLEFAEGRTLEEVLAEEGQLETDRVLNMSLQVCAALKHAHANKILHRDMKPSNLMLMEQENVGEHVYLMDFGIGKGFGRTDVDAQKLTRTGELVGTPTYMSPEQAQGRKQDERSDLYSLGCILYEALTGSPPFISNSVLGTVLQHARDVPLSIPEASMGRAVDPRLEAIVIRLLQKDAELRYQSAEELAKALANVNASPRAPTDLRETEGTAEKSSSKGRPKTSAATISLVAVTIAGLTALAAGVAVFKSSALQTPPSPTTSRAATRVTNTASPTTSPAASPAASTASPTANPTTTPAASSPEVGPTTSPAATAVRPTASPVKSETATSTKASSASSGSSPSPVAEPMQIFSEAMPQVGEESQFRREIIARKIATQSDQFFLSNKFFPYTDQDLTAMRKASHARSVLISGEGITDRGLENLSDLPLVALKVPDTRVRDLHALKNMKTLRALELSRANLNHNAFTILHHLPNLTHLKLDGTPVTDDELLELYTLKNLKSLSLKNCKLLSEKAVSALRKNLPDCKILPEGLPSAGPVPSHDSN